MDLFFKLLTAHLIVLFNQGQMDQDRSIPGEEIKKNQDQNF